VEKSYPEALEPQPSLGSLPLYLVVHAVSSATCIAILMTERQAEVNHFDSNNAFKVQLNPSQCCGSGSTGSTCFWASRIRIRIHWSEVWIRIRILLSSRKNRKKNLDSYYFVTIFDILFLKNDVNVPSKSNMQKKLC
jgi:hypothetical protein